MSYRAGRRAMSLLALLLTGVALTVTHQRQLFATAVPTPADPGGYNVAVETSEAGGGSTWTYTITKATIDAKDLGHFIINFNNCGDQSPALANMVAATVNGVDWLGQVEASEGRTGCNDDSTTFVKTSLRVYEKNSNPDPGVRHD